ncbi:MAG: hypothetical protein GYB68_13650 [Chloroflexi bacterium]|nr:hypothetical protein [Chloroflexota bacterium]
MISREQGSAIEHYPYDVSRRNGERLQQSLLALAVLLIVGLAVAWIVRSGLVEPGIGLIQIGVGIVIGLIGVLTLAGAASVFVKTSDIGLTDEGVVLIPFPFWQIHLAWEALVDCEILELELDDEDDDPNEPKERIVVVSTNRLSLLHWLAGLRFRQRLGPVFLISSYHENYSGILDALRMHQAAGDSA